MQRRSARLPFLFSVMFFYHIAAYMVHPVTPSLIQALGLGDYMFGVMFAAMSVCSFLFSPFWGKINNYISSRTSLFLCCMGYAVGQVFFRFARAEWQFIAARLFAGVFCGGSLVCFLTYIVNVSEPEKRGRNLAINATMLTVAGAFGYFIGGMLGEIDIYLPVDGQIALLVLTGVAFRFGLADDRPAKTAVPPTRELAAECNPFALFAHAGQLLSPQLIVLFLCCTFACLGCTAFDQSFNYYIRDQFGLSSKYNGSIKAILGVISLVSNSTICIWILRKNQTPKYLVRIFAVCAAAMLGVVLLTDFVPFVLVNVLFFIFYYISQPLTQTLVASLSGETNSNTVMGLYNAVSSLGNILGALISGFIYGISPRLPFIFGFAAFAVSTLLAVVFYRRSRSAAA